MFTLLPADFKKDLLRQYRMRVGVLAGVFLLALMLFSFCMFLPSFLAVKTEHMRLSIDEKSVLDRIEDKSKGNFSSTIDGLNADIALLSKSDREISSIIDSIDSKTTSGILINKVNYQSVDKGGFVIQISGIAQNRKGLSQFVKELQKEPSFKSVDLPLGNLALETGAPFSISIEGQ